jgi:hypothetical protein
MVYKRLLILILISLVLLTGCQVLGGNSGTPSLQATPLPFTGGNASVVGASALLLENRPLDVGFTLVPISAGDGRPVEGFAPIEFGVSATYAFSSNRQQIAFVTNTTMSCPNACLHVLNLRTWKEDITPIVLPNSLADWINLAFDPSGERIALFIDSNGGNGGQLLLADLAQDKIIQQVDVSANISQMAFTPNGDLAVYGNLPNEPNKVTIMYVTLFTIPNLSVKWNQDLDMVSFSTESLNPSSDPSLGEYLNPAAVFSLDHSRLYVVAADEPRLVTVDFSRQTVANATIQPPRSLLEKLLDATAGIVYAKMLNGTTKNAVLSADGKYLYVVGTTTSTVKDQYGNLSMQTTPLGLQKVDISSGTEVARLATTASNVSLSLDGKTLLLNGSDDSPDGYAQAWTDVVDAASLKVTDRIGTDLMPSRLLDGSLAWLAYTWTNSGYATTEIYNPDTRSLRSKVTGQNSNDSTWIQIP